MKAACFHVLDYLMRVTAWNLLNLRYSYVGESFFWIFRQSLHGNLNAKHTIGYILCPCFFHLLLLFFGVNLYPCFCFLVSLTSYYIKEQDFCAAYQARTATANKRLDM